MSMYFGPFTVAAGALPNITTSQFPNANVAVFINESPYTLKVDPGTGSYFVISAFTQDAVPLGNQFSGVLKVTASADILFAGSAPVSVLYVQVYARGEPLPGTYPAALARIMNVGNSVPLSATATAIDNEGNPPGTQIIKAVVGGIEHVLMFNDGNLALQKDATSADQEMLDLIDLAVGGHTWGVFLATGATHGLYFMDESSSKVALGLLTSGGMLTNGLLTNEQNMASADQDFFEIAPADDTANIDFALRATFLTSDLVFFDKKNNGEMFRIKNTSGANSGIQVSGIGGRVRAWSTFSGTGTGTFNHGLGATPNVICPTQNVIGSQTMGWDSANATSVHITAGNGSAWSAIALLMA